MVRPRTFVRRTFSRFRLPNAGANREILTTSYGWDRTSAFVRLLERNAGKRLQVRTEMKPRARRGSPIPAGTSARQFVSHPSASSPYRRRAPRHSVEGAFRSQRLSLRNSSSFCAE